jgi:hypothetical protein
MWAMMLPLLLAVLAQTLATPLPPGEGDTLADNGPPIEMIDFLGRRRLCADADGDAAERERLHCAALAGEERGWRTRFAGDTRALRWLDQAPLEFRMELRLIVTFDGPEPARPRRTEQSGTDGEGRHYRLTIDAEADGGRSTRIAAAYDGWPERSFTLSNRAFPLIDLQSLEVGVQLLADDRSFRVELRYGHRRGYCGELGDDREQVTVGFGQIRVSGYATLRTNCQRVYTDIGNFTPPR